VDWGRQLGEREVELASWNAAKTSAGEPPEAAVGADRSAGSSV